MAKLPSVSEINQMNNNTLKTTLKELVKRIEEVEKAAKETQGTQEGVNDPTTNGLLQDILKEVKKFNTERELIHAELRALKNNDELLLDTVAQQQRFLEEIDAEKRAKNLIVIGITEDDLTIAEETAAADYEKIQLVFKTLGLDNADVNTVQRLGRRDPTNPRSRPIKVVMGSSEERQKAFTAAKNLPDDDGSSLSRIRVKKDTHPAIRKEFGRLFAAERSEKEKAENAGKEVIFDKKKRVLTIDGVVIDRFKPSFF